MWARLFSGPALDAVAAGGMLHAMTARRLDALKIAFVGGGNMARALIGGLIAAGVPPTNLAVGEPDAGARERLMRDFGVQCHADNNAAVESAELLLLATKPQVASKVVKALAGSVPDNALVVSIMAGVRLQDIRGWLAGPQAVVRTMPNTPALIGLGITVLVADDALSAEHREVAEQVLSQAGDVLWVQDEALMDAVTAVSGSGPAYFFLVIEALEAAAITQGLPAATARQLALATARGAAEMAAGSELSPAELRTQVTSPGGTTEAALEVLEHDGLRISFERAIESATARSRQLAQALGGDSNQ